MDRREKEILDKIQKQTENIEIPENLGPDRIHRMLEEKNTSVSDGCPGGCVCGDCGRNCGMAIGRFPAGTTDGDNAIG